MEWAVGKQGELMRPDTGKLLLPGSKFHWDIHYSQAGEEITSQVEMGIYFYPKGQEPKFRTTCRSCRPPSARWTSVPTRVSMAEGFMVLRENARIESYQPHMHLRGKAMMVEAVYPTGRREVISLVSNFNFNWMTTYVYADDVAPLLPKGTMLKVTAWHDNTAAKKTNPDPNQWVGWGDRTVDEMAHAWINIVYMKDEDFKAEQEKRRTPPTTQSQAPQQQTVTLARRARPTRRRRPNRRLLCFSPSSCARTTDPALTEHEHQRAGRRCLPRDAGDLGRHAAIAPRHRAVAVGHPAPNRPRPLHHERAGAPQGRQPPDDLEVRGHAGAAGWVERFVDDTDRRQTLVRLTSGGRRVLAECRRRVELRLDEKLATLSPAEREQVTASLRTVRDALVAED